MSSIHYHLVDVSDAVSDNVVIAASDYVATLDGPTGRCNRAANTAGYIRVGLDQIAI